MTRKNQRRRQSHQQLPEDSAAYEKHQKEFAKIQIKEEERLKGHLETFNDGVIAIIITIMVLEVPLPSDSGVDYWTFIRSIVIFLISFFIVANFWYQHHRSFGMITRARRNILLTNFLFLAALSILPLMTKWIMQEQSSFAIMNFGIVYFVVSLTELLLYRFAFVNHYGKSDTAFHFSNRITLIRIWGQLLLNLALILIAIPWPDVTMVLYLSLPILAFFFPDQFTQRRQKKVRLKASLKEGQPVKREQSE
ncbi:TMEM175 family protein [Enterococcus asini]|uniref:TMEM175 family protein n=1 Tax=Enterococcus TaxID=1350 RepID=UPI0028919B0E|nr:TMEM175 family protein [Enterococcus asini]MDT2757865.1 TMEM175 family protein [Enterococcus asini]